MQLIIVRVLYWSNETPKAWLMTAHPILAPARAYPATYKTDAANIPARKDAGARCFTVTPIIKAKMGRGAFAMMPCEATQ